MITTRLLSVLAVAALALSPLASAQDVLIRSATVYTGVAVEPLRDTDVMLSGGVITAIGTALPAGNATVVDADGRALTAGLFGGLSGLGIEDVSGESSTVDHALALNANSQSAPIGPLLRPEFDVTRAYNPYSAAIGVNRAAGITWSVLAPGVASGSGFITGQGAAVRFDGSHDAAVDGSHSLFIRFGSRAARLSGGSRAAQYMLLEQAIDEARTAPLDSDNALLTKAGRAVMLRYADQGRVVAHVERAADILQVLRMAREAGFKPVIAGGAEAWRVAAELARQDVPVLLDSLVNLPGSFDQLAARADNAARLHAAGVRVGFTQSGDATHNARKVRQLAGNAVANGLPWHAALAGLTTVPAQAFGLAAHHGDIVVGKRADLVLWSGDPLEVTTVAEQVWMAGTAVSMQSRQTRLRDRYMEPRQALPRAYMP